MPTAPDLVPCPSCNGQGSIAVSERVAGYLGYETVEADYTCDRCGGTGKLPRDEVELDEIADRTAELLEDETLNPEASRKLLDEFIAGLDNEPERVEGELQRLAETGALLTQDDDKGQGDPDEEESR